MEVKVEVEVMAWQRIGVVSGDGTRIPAMFYLHETAYEARGAANTH